MKATGVGIHFGHHPPESASLDIIVPGHATVHLSLVDLRAYFAEVGDERAQISGDQVIDALEQIVQQILPLAVPFKRGDDDAARSD